MALEKYQAKLNPNNENFWQRPRDNVSEVDTVWYRNIAVGHNTLGNFMKIISCKAQLSQVYTNHCIRATCITALDDNGIEARHIMNVSGHKSETSIKSYARNVSENKKHEMCAVLQKSLHTENIDNSASDVGSNSVTVAQIHAPASNISTDIVPLESVLNSNDQMVEINENDLLDDLLDHTVEMSEKKDSLCNLVNSQSTSVQHVRSGINGPYFHSVHEVHLHYHN